MLNAAEVKRRRESLGLSQAQLGREVGLKQPVIAEIESGLQKTTRKLANLAKALRCSPKDIDPDWEDVDVDGQDIETPYLGNGIREIAADGGLGAGQTPQIAYMPEDGEMKVVDAFRPEAWIFPSRVMRDGFGASADKFIAVATRGDSMHPTISHGSFVFVDTRDTRVKPQELYALRDVYGDIIIKRLDIFKENGEWRVRIQSDNPSTHSREELLDEVSIIGRVKGIFRLI